MCHVVGTIKRLLKRKKKKLESGISVYSDVMSGVIMLQSVVLSVLAGLTHSQSNDDEDLRQLASGDYDDIRGSGDYDDIETTTVPSNPTVSHFLLSL